MWMTIVMKRTLQAHSGVNSTCCTKAFSVHPKNETFKKHYKIPAFQVPNTKSIIRGAAKPGHSIPKSANSVFCSAMYNDALTFQCQMGVACYFLLSWVLPWICLRLLVGQACAYYTNDSIGTFLPKTLVPLRLWFRKKSHVTLRHCSWTENISVFIQRGFPFLCRSFLGRFNTEQSD